MLGIQSLSSAESGGGNGNQFFLAGQVADIRLDVTTAETTATNLKAHGVSWLGTTSTGNGTVYTLDPPIPGITKHIALTCGASDGPVYIKTGGPTIETSAGSTYQTIKLSTRQYCELLAVSTGRWMLKTLGVTLQETT
jgi:hypothetical protein